MRARRQARALPRPPPDAVGLEPGGAMRRIRKTIVRRATGLVLGLSLAGAVTGAGQAPPGLREVRSWGTGGLGLVVGLPVGQFRSFVDVAGGVAGSFAVNLDGRGAVALRFDGAYLQYGNEDRPLALAGSGGRGSLDMNTSFFIASLRAGPQGMLGPGRGRGHGFGTIRGAEFAARARTTRRAGG